ncbi:MAG TPA: hypothetical protein VJ774_03755, partial [Actinomycetota bacterium]|nr:hypothetical protein [Actinomycetota bacterium]
MAVVVPTLVGLTMSIVRHRGDLSEDEFIELAVWILIIALVELVPVPVWRGVHISMGFPLMMVLAFLYPANAAAAAAFLAASDPRELRREVGILRALFNRCQVALAVGSAGVIFHAMAEIETSSVAELLLAASLASVADYVVNTSLVCIAASIHFSMNPLRVIRELKVGRLSEYLISYFGLAVFGVILARIFSIEDLGKDHPEDCKPEIADEIFAQATNLQLPDDAQWVHRKMDACC